LRKAVLSERLWISFDNKTGLELDRLKLCFRPDDDLFRH